jgi:hypothetical protein
MSKPTNAGFAARCDFCGGPTKEIQVVSDREWSETATGLVTVRACTNRYCEGFHPAVRQRI